MTGSDNKLHRNGESNLPAARTDRLFRSDGRWYFKTREEQNVGPYTSFVEVSRALPLFVDFAKSLSSERVQSLIEHHNKSIEKRVASTKKVSQNESLSTAVSTCRIYFSDNAWFYKTPEGRKAGPYHSNEEAKKVAALFSDFSDKLPEERIIQLLEKYILNDTH